MSPDLTAPYCTDEDIFVRDPGNFLDLIPAHQVVAAGTDGVIDPSAPWTLASATAAFTAAGVASGSVVRLVAPDDDYATAFTAFAVESATATTLTLRRVGLPAGAGQPPAPGSAIAYSIRTLSPQVHDAAYDLNQRHGIDGNFYLRSPNYLYDARELRQAAVLTVLVRLYTSQSRTGDGDWAAKLAAARADLDDVASRLTIRWGPLGEGQPSANRTSARVIR